MKPQRGVRAVHRWVSIVFTLTVIANFAFLAIGHGKPPPAWATYSPLPPLAVLMMTGLYLFVSSHAFGQGRKEPV